MRWGHFLWGVAVGVAALWVWYNVGPRVGMGFGNGRTG